jgi:uncharacterized protein
VGRGGGEALSERQYPERSWLSPFLEVRESRIEGRGLFATDQIEPGTVIATMGGTVVTDVEFRGLRLTKYSAAAIGEGLNILHSHDTPLQYGNQSCDSNMWMDDEITISARRVIPQKVDATIDYALFTVAPTWWMQCRCGAGSCRGVVTGDDWRLPAVQERYRGHFSPFINHRIDEVAGS